MLYNHCNNVPPKRTSTAARAAAAAPMTAVVVEQLIKARVSAKLANHETLRNSTNNQGDRSHNSDIGMRGTVCTSRECTYMDFLNCKPLTFKGTEGVVVLTQWFEKMESLFHISNCAVENQVKFSTCTFLGIALTWWNSHMKDVTQDVAYAMDWKTLRKMMTDKYYPRDEIKKLEIELWNLKEVKKYVDGLPDMIQENVMSYQPKTMAKAIEFANDYMGKKVLTISETNRGNQRGNGNAPTKVYVVGNAGTNPDSNVVTELGSFDVIIGVDWLLKYHAVIDCTENIVRIPWGNETLLVYGDRSNQGNETRLNIISCTKTQKYLLKGNHVFLAHVTTKETEDKSVEKRL
nr:hypothetical protein [Tanacetum cinerariifolium]